MLGGRRRRWLTMAAAVLASGLTLSQVEISMAAFTAQTAGGADSWSAASVQPVSGLTGAGSCGAPASVVSSTATSQSGSGVTLTVPSAVAAGDLLIAQVVSDLGSIAPTGFTDVLVTAGDKAFGAVLYQRTATSDDVGKSYTWALTGKKASASLLVARGAAGPLTAADVAGTPPSKTVDVVAPTMDVSVPGSRLITLYGLLMPGESFSTPAGMTELYDHGGTAGTSQAAFSELRTSAGPTGTRTSTATAVAESVGQSVVVRPDGSSGVELAWTPSSSSFTTGYTVLRDGVSYDDVAGASTASWIDSAPTSGSHTYTVIAAASAWRSAPVSVVATLPSCGPTAVVAPLPTFVAGTFTATANASSEAAIVSVRFQWAPSGTGTWTDVCTHTGGPWTCSIATTAGADGGYDLRVVVTDSTGATAVSAIAQTTVDNTAPSVTMNDPGTPMAGTVTLTAAASDALSGTANVVFELAPTGGSTWTAACTASTAPYSCTYDASPLAAGSYDLRAVATDNAGNVGISAPVVNRQVGTWLGYGSTSSSVVRTSSGKSDVPYPSGTQPGDLLLLVQANAADQAITTPAGWTLAADQRMSNPEQFRFTVWWRPAGTETAISQMNVNTNSSGTSLWISRFARPAGLPAVTTAHSAVREGQSAPTGSLTPTPDVTTTAPATVISIAAVRGANPLSLSTAQGFTQHVTTTSTAPAAPTIGVAATTASGGASPPSPTWLQSGSTASQWAWTTLAFR